MRHSIHIKSQRMASVMRCDFIKKLAASRSELVIIDMIEEREAQAAQDRIQQIVFALRDKKYAQT